MFEGIETLQKMIYEHPRKKKHTIERITILQILRDVQKLSNSNSWKESKLSQISGIIEKRTN